MRGKMFSCLITLCWLAELAAARHRNQDEDIVDLYSGSVDEDIMTANGAIDIDSPSRLLGEMKDDVKCLDELTQSEVYKLCHHLYKFNMKQRTRDKCVVSAERAECELGLALQQCGRMVADAMYLKLRLQTTGCNMALWDWIKRKLGRSSPDLGIVHYHAPECTAEVFDILWACYDQNMPKMMDLHEYSKLPTLHKIRSKCRAHQWVANGGMLGLLGTREQLHPPYPPTELYTVCKLLQVSSARRYEDFRLCVSNYRTQCPHLYAVWHDQLTAVHVGAYINILYGDMLCMDHFKVLRQGRACVSLVDRLMTCAIVDHVEIIILRNTATTYYCHGKADRDRRRILSCYRRVLDNECSEPMNRVLYAYMERLLDDPVVMKFTFRPDCNPPTYRDIIRHATAYSTTSVSSAPALQNPSPIPSSSARRHDDEFSGSSSSSSSSLYHHIRRQQLYTDDEDIYDDVEDDDPQHLPDIDVRTPPLSDESNDDEASAERQLPSTLDPYDPFELHSVPFSSVVKQPYHLSSRAGGVIGADIQIAILLVGLHLLLAM